MGISISATCGTKSNPGLSFLPCCHVDMVLLYCSMDCSGRAPCCSLLRKIWPKFQSVFLQRQITTAHFESSVFTRASTNASSNPLSTYYHVQVQIDCERNLQGISNFAKIRISYTFCRFFLVAKHSCRCFVLIPLYSELFTVNCCKQSSLTHTAAFSGSNSLICCHNSQSRNVARKDDKQNVVQILNSILRVPCRF